MEPTSGKGGFGCSRIFQIAFHDQISTHENFTHGLPVLWHWLQGFGVGNHHLILQRGPNALTRQQLGPIIDTQFLPLLMWRADNTRAIGLGQSVDMANTEAHVFHAGDHRSRRCRASRHRTHCLADALFKLVSGIDQGIEHHRCSAEVCDSVRLNRIENSFVPNVPQTDAGAGNGSERPGETPAVAVKHRQRPEVDRVSTHIPTQCHGNRVQIGTPVVIHHPFGITGSSRGVIE